MKVIIDEITTQTEEQYFDGEKEVESVLMTIEYTLHLEGSHKLYGEIVVPYDNYRDMSIADHEKQILELIILEAKHSEGGIS